MGSSELLVIVIAVILVLFFIFKAGQWRAESKKIKRTILINKSFLADT